MNNYFFDSKLKLIKRKLIVTPEGVTVPVWSIQVEFQFGELPEAQVINNPARLLPAPPAMAALPAPSPSGGGGCLSNSLFCVLKNYINRNERF